MPNNIRKKNQHLNTIAINLGCGCSRPKLSSFFNPKQKTKTPPYHKHSNFSFSSSTSSTTWDKNVISSSPFSPYLDTITTTTTTNTVNTSSSSSSSSACGVGQTVWPTPKSMAVEKGSSDPYRDTITTTTTNTVNTSFSSSSSSACGVGQTVWPTPKSVAVEKESNDPYLDFRESMLQMIVENDIYNKNDLKELLNCFLQLNSPSLHGVIIRVFTEIWNAFFFSSRPKYYQL